jgi:hypothetical protein
LVEPFRVTPLIVLEENSNFRVLNNIFVDVDAEELNVVLSSVDKHRSIKMMIAMLST